MCLIIFLSLINVIKFSWGSEDICIKYCARVQTCAYKGILFKIGDFRKVLIETDRVCTNI